MEILLVWLGVAVVTGLAANARGRSGFGWFLLGLMFSLVALLAVLVMRNLRAEKERREIARIAAEAARPRDPAAEEAERLRRLEPWRGDEGAASLEEWRAATRAAADRGRGGT